MPKKEETHYFLANVADEILFLRKIFCGKVGDNKYGEQDENLKASSGLTFYSKFTLIMSKLTRR